MGDRGGESRWLTTYNGRTLHLNYNLRTKNRNLATNEKLRRSFKPKRITILFVGESPPASGRFFYEADSGLYRAMHEAFAAAFPQILHMNFLKTFRELGCYFVDLCEVPVDRLSPGKRKTFCSSSEPRLARMLRRFRPKLIISVVRSIEGNVERAHRLAKWQGARLELPYPGRWWKYRSFFVKQLVKMLRKIYFLRMRENRGAPYVILPRKKFAA